MPCVVCDDLADTRWDSLYDASALGSPTLTRDLERSAATGDCQFCFVLYRGIRKVYRNVAVPEAFYFWRQEDSGTEERLLWFTPSDYDPSAARVFSEFHSFPKDGAECDAVPPSFPISGDASGDECVEFAQLKISDCLKNHTECAKPISQRKMRPSGMTTMQRLERGVQGLLHSDHPPRRPTRLLNAGSPGSSTIRLLETAQATDQEAPYACLSHCWGKTQPLKTETSSLEARKAGIAWSTLPKTFQDAADFTRRLGLRYLWIDSLCIVQDSKEDWRRESSRMAAIYENCFVCLAATASPDHQGGLYFAQPNRGVSIKVLDLVEAGETYEICVRRRALRHPEMTRRTPVGNDETGFPLLERGWVFQEMVLSPRIVHFWEYELYFQCMEDHACECDAELRDGIYKAAHAEALGGSDAWAVRERWRDMVTQYSKLRLTYATDKLPALAGLAKQMMRFRSDRYLAGLWEGSLFEDLCWTRPPSSSPSSDVRPEPGSAESSYVAPSWSWASVLHPVEYVADMTNRLREDRFVPDAKLIKVEVNNVDPQDPTGQVISGFLTLSAVWSRTNPEKEKAGRTDDVNEDLYYLRLGEDGSSWTWLVLEPVARGRQAEPQQYRRKDCIRAYPQAYETGGPVREERRLFTII